MKFIRKITALTDGSKVHDVDIVSNGRLDGKRVCIFSCISEDSADEFFSELTRLIERHTVECVELSYSA